MLLARAWLANHDRIERKALRTAAEESTSAAWASAVGAGLPSSWCSLPLYTQSSCDRRALRLGDGGECILDVVARMLGAVPNLAPLRLGESICVLDSHLLWMRCLTAPRGASKPSVVSFSLAVTESAARTSHSEAPQKSPTADFREPDSD